MAVAAAAVAVAAAGERREPASQKNGGEGSGAL